MKLVTELNLNEVTATLSPSMVAYVKDELAHGEAVAVDSDGTVYTGALPEQLRDAADAAEFSTFKAEAV